jgi:thioredoxin 1
MAIPAAPCSVPRLDEASFERQVLPAAGPVLVHLAAQACGACPSARRLCAEAARRGLGARCYCLDATRAPDLCRRYSVTHLPTILLFRGGKVVRRLVGDPLPDDLEMILRVETVSAGRG